MESVIAHLPRIVEKSIYALILLRFDSERDYFFAQETIDRMAFILENGYGCNRIG